MTVTLATQKPFTVAIVGGGIGGLALAIGLHRQNVPFHIYEAAHAFAEVGAGVGFGPNAQKAMGLIDPEIRRRYDEKSTTNGSPEKFKIMFEYFLGADIPGLGNAGQKIHQVNVETGQSTIHRAVFLDELVSLVPKDMVSFGKKLIDTEEVGDKVRIRFEDGTHAEADAVVGCDGCKSHVRPMVLGNGNPATHPQFTGKYAYRGLVPMDQAIAAIGKDRAANSNMWLGPHGHLLTIPIEKGKIMNVVAFRSKEDGKWQDERWVLPLDKQHMLDDFAGWGPEVRGVLDLCSKPDLWALFDHPPADTYCRGRIAVAGDAAHASTPHQGSGAGMALEDAYIMSGLLGSITTAAEIHNAFKAYDTTRRSRTQKLVTTSRELGEIYDFERLRPDVDLPAFQKNLSTRFGWIWDHDLESELTEAKRFLNGST
ncbi:MAG: hypothetical protein Q9220_000507 [cf. Caloplaca sp. 1 TL-2023]